MEEIADQLKKLIHINRKIINQFHKDEMDLGQLREYFDERGEKTEKLISATKQFDSSNLSEQDEKVLSKLFERFEQQDREIQETLSYIREESGKRLDDAIKTNKAEKSYNSVQQ